MEDYHPSSRGGGPGPNNVIGIGRRFSECSGDEGGSMGTSPSTAMTPTHNITENILFMKLFYEFKQLYPKVSDETVGQCVRQVSNQELCLNLFTIIIKEEIG